MRLRIKKIIFISFLFLFLFGLFFIPPFLVKKGGIVSAQEIKYPAVPGAETPQEFLAKIKWCKDECQRDSTSQTCKDCQKEYPPESAFPYYIKYFYHLFLWIAGPVLLIVLIWGGIQYFTAGDSAVRKNEAKDRIFTGFLGILLLFLSYLILITISPQFVLVLERGLEKPEFPKLPKIDISQLKFPYVELAIEDSIKKMLCSESLCGGEVINENDIRYAINCGDSIEDCRCKKIKVKKMEKKKIDGKLQCEINEEEIEKKCLLDVISEATECFKIQFKVVNDHLKKLASDLRNKVVATCNCTLGCTSLTEPCPLSCVESANPCLYPDWINNKREEIQKYVGFGIDPKTDEPYASHPEYQRLEEAARQLAEVKCGLYQALFKLEKADAIMAGCASQLDVTQPTSQPELRNYLLEAQKMGGPKTKTKKFYENLDIDKLIKNLANALTLATIDITKPENRQNVYNIWRDLRSFVLYAPDSPVNFYCPTTSQFPELHQDAEIAAYSGTTGIKVEEIKRLIRGGYLEKALALLGIFGRFQISDFLDVFQCRLIPTFWAGVFPPEEEELINAFEAIGMSTTTATDATEKFIDFWDFVKETPPEEIEKMFTEFQEEVLMELKDYMEGKIDKLINELMKEIL